jgi:hypothetical protein
VRQGEVAAGGQIVVFEVDAVDGEEIRVQIIEVVENPVGLGRPLLNRLQPGRVTQPVTEAGQPRPAFPSSPPFFFSACPSARSTMSLTIRSSWSSVTALDCSKAM